jgi:uncharacterized membrane protein
MKTVIQSKKMRYVVLILVLVTNLLIFSASITSLPWNFAHEFSTNGLMITTSILALLSLTFLRKDLKDTDNQVKLAVPLVGILINVFYLVLGTSNLKTDLSLLITMLLIITAFSISFPRSIGNR